MNPLHPRMLCAKFDWNWPIGSGEEDFFLNLSIYFYYIPIISPLGTTCPFIWTNLNPFHSEIISAMFGWNWPSGSGEKDENVKSLQTDGRTDRQADIQIDDGRQVIRKAHLSFQLRWTKKECRLYNFKVGKSYKMF